MKIVFPVEEFCGMESPLFGHFGSAPCFALADSEANTVAVLDNQDREHEHGHCNPVQALAGAQVDAVVVGGIGAGALNGLVRAGIRVFRADTGSIGDALAQLKSGTLPEVTAQDVCGAHAGGCGCSHH